MTRTMFCFCVALSVVPTLARIESQGWIDPHSPDGDPELRPPCDCKDWQESGRDMITRRYQRTLGLLLNTLEFDADTGNYKGVIAVDLSTECHDYIKEFSLVVKNDTVSWNKLDGILSDVYTRSKVNKNSDFLMGLGERLLYRLYGREILVLSAVMTCLIVIYNLLRSNITVKMVFKYLLLFMFVIDFAFVWMRLLEEKELEKMANTQRYKTVPPECDPNSMGMLQYIMYKVWGDNDEKCKVYHIAKYRDDFWHVNPMKVVGTQLGDFLEPFMNGVGIAFGQFMTSIIGKMSWYTILFIPILLLFIVVIACILLSFLTNTSFGFNFLHLIQFDFGKGEREKIGDFISRSKLRTLLETVDRLALRFDPPEADNRKGEGPKRRTEIQDVGPEETLEAESTEKPTCLDDDSHDKSCRALSRNSEKKVAARNSKVTTFHEEKSSDDKNSDRDSLEMPRCFGKSSDVVVTTLTDKQGTNLS